MKLKLIDGKWFIIDDENKVVSKSYDEESFAKIALEALEYEQLESMFGVEIFATGTHNGDKYTEVDIDAMIDAFAALDYIPPLKFGHAKDTPGMPALGWVKNLRRVGEKMLADFTDMPQQVYQAIKDKRYDRVSSEIYWNLTRGEKLYSRALKAVALLGADIPAVAGLKPLHQMFSDTDAESVKFCDVTSGDLQKPPKSKQGDNKMPTELETQVATLSTDLAAANAAAKTAQEALDASNARLLALENERVAEKITAKVAACSIPALQPLVHAAYEQLHKSEPAKEYSIGDKKVKGADVLDELVAGINSLAKGLFKEFSKQTGEENKFEDAGAELNKRITEYRAKNKEVAYSAAMNAVLEADPQLKKAYAATL